MKVLIYKDTEGQWRWRASRKGRITADSGEGYANKANAQRAFAAFVTAVDQWERAATDFVYE